MMPRGDPDRNREETRLRAAKRRATRMQHWCVETRPGILESVDRLRAEWNLPSRAAVIERLVQMQIDKP